MYVYSLFSEIFQHCIYRQLKARIRKLESKHYFFTSFSKREQLFSFTLVLDWIRAVDKPVWIALLDFSSVMFASNTNVVMNLLENELPNQIQILKSLLEKSNISTNLNKTNDKNIYKIVMQFFWSNLLSECFPPKKNTGINFISRETGNPFNQPSSESPLPISIRGFVFVDLILFMSHAEKELKSNLKCFMDVLDTVSLDYKELKVTISVNKPSSTNQSSSRFNCFGKQIELSPSVNILGIPFGFGKIRDDEIFSRIETARKVKKGTQYSILPSEDINITIKRYMVNILEPLLLNLDILPIDSTDETLLTRFHDIFITEIQGRNIFVRKSSVLTTKSIPTILSYKRLVLFGDVCRLSPKNNARRLLYGNFNSNNIPECFLNLCFADLQKFELDYTECVDKDSWVQTLDSKLSGLE
ncbi:hypothetical protein Bpfe_017986 [Biomphalaria pfeifferi]|uniref:Uncharacterized protein n=1 Tax=Biomphalaria pfeifferi TaxID=112525 RepID=A0AAD8BE46_BIOPF|nr:hypothetical protein Bpfe_017986 [Biomphalaria pfeifferi]